MWLLSSYLLFYVITVLFAIESLLHNIFYFYLILLTLFPFYADASFKLALHIPPNSLFSKLGHSLIVVLTIRTASSNESLRWPPLYSHQPRTKFVVRKNSYSEAAKVRTPESRCSAFRSIDKSLAVGGSRTDRLWKPAMPGPAAGSKARVYADVNKLKSKEYWDYEAHVPSWR